MVYVCSGCCIKEFISLTDHVISGEGILFFIILSSCLQFCLEVCKIVVACNTFDPGAVCVCLCMCVCVCPFLAHTLTYFLLGDK